MIEKLIEKYQEFTNKKELAELTKERDEMRELLLFNLRTSDKLVKDIREILNSEELYYDQKIKINCLLEEYEWKSGGI